MDIKEDKILFIHKENFYQAKGIITGVGIPTVKFDRFKHISKKKCI